MVDHRKDVAASGAAGPLADPVSEAIRVVDDAGRAGLTIRVLGGAAVRMQAPSENPLLPRPIGDIDINATAVIAAARVTLGIFVGED